MTTVDPSVLYLQVPKSLRADAEADSFWQAKQRFDFEIWTRTGGSLDTIGDTSTAVTTLDTSVTALDGTVGTLETAVTALQSTVNAIATGSPTYAPVNGSALRVWDANDAAGTISASPTQAEVENLRDAILALSDVVATLADDLAAKGIIG